MASGVAAARSHFFFISLHSLFRSRQSSTATAALPPPLGTSFGSRRLRPRSVNPKRIATSPESGPLKQPEKKREFSDTIVGWLTGIVDRIKEEGIGLEIMDIAIPAVFALAADPISSLVDTAFVGHLGSVELAAVGVSISVFNLVSKLFNIPLLNITASFVAEEQAMDGASKGLNSQSVSQKETGVGKAESRKFLPAVSTSLALAAIVGVTEAIALFFGSGILMNFMGISVDSPLRLPAEQFLVLRAYGAPAIVVALAAQGTFRGLMDTKTPLYAVTAGNLLNVILDPILIFLLGFGAGGAAVSTVVSEYLIAFILLWKLSTKVVIVIPNIFGVRFIRYLRSGGLLILRTVMVLLTMTISTSVVARGGPVIMAGHQICMQVWLAVSLLNDALALAGQALLARAFARGNYKQARLILIRVLQIGVVTGVALGVFLFFGFQAFSHIFTPDSAVLDVARSGIWFVSLSQPVNALAFVFDGLYYGVSDFAYAAYSMVLVAFISSAFLLISYSAFGLPGVRMGLFFFMSLRVGAGIWRLGTQCGPWKMVLLDVGETRFDGQQ